MQITFPRNAHVALFRVLTFLIFSALAMFSLTAAPKVEAATILVLGDSLSAGFGIGQNEAWPNLLQRKLQTDPNFAKKGHRVINASISGETTAGGRQRLGTLLDQHRPDIVIVELGANDGLRGLALAAMKTNLEAILKLNQQKGARSLLIGMRLPPNYGPYADAFAQTFASLAKQTQTPTLPFLLDRLQQSPQHFQADGLHPTREAQSILLDNVWPVLKPMLN